VYVLDTSAFIVVGHYFPDRFPSFWAHLAEVEAAGRLTSVSEVAKELDNMSTREHLARWLEAHPALFPTPSSAEMDFVARIFGVTEFQALVKEKDRLKGSPVADPFVIARAATIGGCVVTEERARPNIVRIPTVCAHFGIDCVDIEGLMRREGWQY
jgi:pseudouridine-5'-phosphate glycosidase